MNIKQLFQDEDAVSPVIGVILMVAITVILAAVIGTFVLGLGDQVQSSAPNANFQFEYTGTWDGATSSTATVIHNGGQDVDAGNVNVLIGGSTVIDSGQQASSPPSGITVPDSSSDWYDGSNTQTISTGDAVEIEADGTSGTDRRGNDILVVWESPNGDSSNTIGESTIPS